MSENIEVPIVESSGMIVSSNKDKKVVAGFASDSPYYPTGFAVQCSHIANLVAEELDWETHYLGWQTRGNPKIEGYKFKVHGVRGNAPFGKDSYQDFFRKISPDVIFTQGDAHMVDVLSVQPRPFWIMYFPIDGDPLNNTIANVVRKADIKVAMSKFGQELTSYQLRINDVEYIPHGVNTNTFSPIDKKIARKEIFTKLGINIPNPEEAFIFGCVARLNKRKHHMRLLEAFRIFLEKNEERRKNCYLYLHLDPKDSLYIGDPNHDYFFLEQIEVRGIANNVIITPERLPNNSTYEMTQGISEMDLALLYNAFDVHVLTTGGEGFGIPIVEAMACGKPNILTDYTTSREFIDINEKGEEISLDEKRGITVDPSILYMEMCGVRKAWVDVKKFASAMDMYYEQPDIMEKHGKNAREFAVKNYSWEVVDKMWLELFERIHNDIGLVI